MSASTRLAVMFVACLALDLERAGILLAQSTPSAATQPGGSVEARDPSDTRLALMPTARVLPRGAFSLTLLDIFLPVVRPAIRGRRWT